MEQYKIIYKHPDYPARKLSVVVSAEGEEDARLKFKHELFKNFEIVAIVPIF